MKIKKIVDFLTIYPYDRPSHHEWKRISKHKIPRWAKSNLRNSLYNSSTMNRYTYNMRMKTKGKKYKYMLKTCPTAMNSYEEKWYRRKK